MIKIRGERVAEFARRLLPIAQDATAAVVPEPLPADRYEPVKVDVGTLWIETADQVMRPFMQEFGTWEPEEGELLRRLIRHGCRFLDVGANIGYFSLLAFRAGAGTIDSVEPDPGNVRALRFNAWVNGVPANVWPLALDDHDRSLRLTSNATNRGDLRTERVSPGPASTTAKRTSGKRSGSGDRAVKPEGWLVPATSGREIFAGRSFDVVKIDVQGWEFEVLLGLEPVLRDSANVKVVTEFWPTAIRAQQRVPQDILANYRAMGYAVRASVAGELRMMSDSSIVSVCDSAGENGQVNLLLER